MKKLFALLLALCLSVSVMAVFAEEEDEFGYYTKDHPEAEVYVNTWVAEDGDWRVEVFDEDGGLKLGITHRLGDNKEDMWEYAAAMAEDGTTLTAVPLGLHYRQDTVSGDWDETYYEDGDANFTINENGMLVWEDLKEGAGDGMEFMPIGNFYGGRWMKDDIEVIFFDWYEGEYDVRCYKRDENGSITDDAILKGTYDPETDTLTVSGCFNDGEVFDVTFSYDDDHHVVWTQDGVSTVLEYSYFTD